MLCYRDRTFCPYWTDCRLGSECSAAYTTEVKAAAAKWWENDNAQVALFYEKPDCWEGED